MTKPIGMYSTKEQINMWQGVKFLNANGNDPYTDKSSINKDSHNYGKNFLGFTPKSGREGLFWQFKHISDPYDKEFTRKSKLGLGFGSTNNANRQEYLDHRRGSMYRESIIKEMNSLKKYQKLNKNKNYNVKNINNNKNNNNIKKIKGIYSVFDEKHRRKSHTELLEEKRIKENYTFYDMVHDTDYQPRKSFRPRSADSRQTSSVYGRYQIEPDYIKPSQYGSKTNKWHTNEHLGLIHPLYSV